MHSYANRFYDNAHELLTNPFVLLCILIAVGAVLVDMWRGGGSDNK